ncbi:helix-turn-helix domain-containing protein [Dactylosporangium fulvum]|uniref:Helix-turn-helix transcriptional regulator n=1 Tax=Dactylosporangium fulvum TaxID=53359 RepID=A0ABY5VTW1_9ACTN|nr:helix-turn-helix transcriptional regulator [Dactylosporangium fulvum]UWP81168.1 helix-turn-helix transcriptional regulator [Dactylosporangium fulvum]
MNQRALDAAESKEEFAELLDRLHVFIGRPSYRTLSARSANGTSIARTTISEWLRGKRFPSMEGLRALLAVCEVRPPFDEPWLKAWRQVASIEKRETQRRRRTEVAELKAEVGAAVAAHRKTLVEVYEFATALVDADSAVGVRLHQLVHDICDRRFGAEDQSTLAAAEGLARALVRDDRTSAAVELLRSCLEARSRIFGPTDPTTLVTQSLLADACCVVGDLAEAHRLHADVLFNRRRILGEDHPDTGASRERLAAVVDMQRVGRIG